MSVPIRNAIIETNVEKLILEHTPTEIELIDKRIDDYLEMIEALRQRRMKLIAHLEIEGIEYGKSQG